MKAQQIGVEIVDVNGQYARFCRQFPGALRQAMKKYYTVPTAERLSDEMYDRAPARSEFAPHIKDAIDVKVTSQTTAMVGILEGEAESGTEATMGEVALYNEYGPNQNNAFELPAAHATEGVAAANAGKALASVEREFTV